VHKNLTEAILCHARDSAQSRHGDRGARVVGGGGDCDGSEARGPDGHLLALPLASLLDGHEGKVAAVHAALQQRSCVRVVTQDYVLWHENSPPLPLASARLIAGGPAGGQGQLGCGGHAGYGGGGEEREELGVSQGG